MLAETTTAQPKIVNGINVDNLFALVDGVRLDAAKGKTTWRVTKSWPHDSAGLAGVSRRRFVRTTVRDGSRQAPDLVERAFKAKAPNRLWVADITYIPSWSGFLYLAIVLDAFSRRIVGWSMSLTLHAESCLRR